MGGSIDNDFYGVRVVIFLDGFDSDCGGGHFGRSEGGGDFVDDQGVDQRLVPLDVNHSVARISLRDLGDAIGAARMVGPGHFHFAEVLGNFPNLGVIGGNKDLGERFGLLASFDHMLDQRFACNQRQGLAGEASGTVTGWNYTYDFHPRSIAARELTDAERKGNFFVEVQGIPPS